MMVRKIKTLFVLATLVAICSIFEATARPICKYTHGIVATVDGLAIGMRQEQLSQIAGKPRSMEYPAFGQTTLVYGPLKFAVLEGSNSIQRAVNISGLSAKLGQVTIRRGDNVDEVRRDLDKSGYMFEEDEWIDIPLESALLRVHLGPGDKVMLLELLSSAHLL